MGTWHGQTDKCITDTDIKPISSISCFLIFHSQSLEFTTCQHPRISVTSYFQTSSKDITFSQPTPFQLPTLPRISLSTRPDTSETLVLYKSCTYSYLLTYFIKMSVQWAKSAQWLSKLHLYKNLFSSEWKMIEQMQLDKVTIRNYKVKTSVYS